MKGIIFDMDGTMVDNMMVHHRAWQKQLATLGLELSLEEVRQKVHGVNHEILARLFGDRFTPAERYEIAFAKEAAYREIFLPELQLLNGLDHLLKEIFEADIPMAIGSAAPPENIDFVLDNLNLRPFFQAVFHSENVSKGKPDPEIFQKAAASMGFVSADCLIFEDSVVGVETAMNAGCKVIVVTTTHKEEEFQKFPNVVQFISDYSNLGLSDILKLVA